MFGDIPDRLSGLGQGPMQDKRSQKGTGDSTAQDTQLRIVEEQTHGLGTLPLEVQWI